MFAIVKIGNQQFRVKAGDFIRAPFQKLSPGDKIDISVLAFGTENDIICDSSQLKKTKVKALLLRQSLAPKIIVFKKKRRKGYRRTQGHRQKITEFKILELCSPDGKVSKAELKQADKKAKRTQLVSKKSGQSVKKTALKAKNQTGKKEAPVMKTKAKKSAEAKKPAVQEAQKSKKQTKRGD